MLRGSMITWHVLHPEEDMALQESGLRASGHKGSDAHPRSSKLIVAGLKPVSAHMP